MRRFLRGVRAAVRLAAAAAVTLFSYLLALASGALGIVSPTARVRGQGAAFQLWSRALCRIFGVRVERQGTAPAPPFLLVSNHLSYIDILVLGTSLPCVFVAKAEIDGWPVFGAICRSVNTIFIDRRMKRKLPEILRRIEAALAARQGVVIFPEGTSGPGDGVLPFRSSLLELAAGVGRPVHHVTINYRVAEGEMPAHLSVGWWGDMPLGEHLKNFLALSRVEASLHFGDEPFAADDRKRLAADLQREVASRFLPFVEREEVERLLRLRHEDPESLPAVLRKAPDRFR
ncbi:MAG: lysophospholipid acyltransferase family protein [Thermoanaerobaculia bacterium]